MTHDDSVRAKAQSIVDQYRFLNDGNGMIVPQHVAKTLKEMGIHDGYVVSLPIPARARPASAP